MEKQIVLKKEDMVKNVIHFIFFFSGKQPTRKTDIIKVSMNNQAKDFKAVIAKVDWGLRMIFGNELVGLKNGPKGEEGLITCGIQEATSFVIRSKFRQGIVALVAPNQTFETDVKKAALLLILSCSYMMQQTLDERIILDIFDSMEITPHLFSKGDLRSYLKSEYVDSMYLTKHEVSIEDGTEVTLKYGWGIRAEVEFSKYAILKFVSKVLGRNPGDFLEQFGKLSLEEIEQVDGEVMRCRSGEESDIDQNESIDDEES